ncbi:MAG: hypothetical protein IT580_12305 [Verrucomicrobiales bacterium]|nr:hypothetical protein [Verrucomicrobiales bacterium]
MTATSASRRGFLRSLAATTAVVSAAGPTALATATHAAQPARRKTIALLGTVVFKHSHAQHFIDRFALGYGWQGEWQPSGVDLVSLYIDQFPEGDLGRDRAKRYGIPLYSSIREALCRGGDQLAVDGVVIIGEHGNYPKTESGQTLYPRHRWFKEVVRVFESAGRSVPVFNDKHLSTSWTECAEMVEDARRLRFPFLAGSSLPVTWRLPALDVPFGTPLEESVCACYGGVDSYDFHGLETAQCMSERRRGGETGIRSVHALRGARVWEAMAARPKTQRLLAAALSRSHTLPVENGFPTGAITYDWARQAFPDPIGYFIEHRDGFHTSMFLLPIRDFNYAGLRADDGRVIACQMYLPMPGSSATTADFFNPLVHHIERMVIERRAPYPVERTLLTSGMTLAAVESLHRGQVRVETPEMTVRYRAPKASTFWRD